MVDLEPTEEQALIVESIDTLLHEALPVERLRESLNTGAAAERRRWQDLVEVGLFGLGLSTTEGGPGYGLAEEALAARTMGRYCVSPTVLATMLAVHVAASCGRADLREAFQSGHLRAAFANPLDNEGTAHLLDAGDCDWLLVLDEPIRLAARETPGAASEVCGLDETVRLERSTLDRQKSFSADLGERVSLLLAAYLVGNAQATLAMAVAYATTRQQFGQPIGAFQAIKHSCADMAVRAAAAQAQTLFAAVTAEAARSPSDLTQRTSDVACARLLARQAAVANAKANIQIHGAMGFTAECDAHLFLKRALTLGALGADTLTERTQILQKTPD